MSITDEGKGSHFDPVMVEAFLTVQDKVKSIAARYADSDADMNARRKQLELLSPTLH